MSFERFENDRFAEVVHYLKHGFKVVILHNDWMENFYRANRILELDARVPNCLVANFGSHRMLWVED